MKRLLLLLCPFYLLACSPSQPSLPTAKNLDVERYAGKWHEIARLPTFFQKDMVAARATYGVLPDGSISVLNEGIKSGGERNSISGKATPFGNTPDGEAKLKVRFDKFPVSLFEGNYWIIDLNDAHTHAIVGTPSRKMLWLLSKEPSAKASDFTQGIERMRKQGFPMNQLIVNAKRVQ